MVGEDFNWGEVGGAKVVDQPGHVTIPMGVDAIRVAILWKEKSQKGKKN